MKGVLNGLLHVLAKATDRELAKQVQVPEGPDPAEQAAETDHGDGPGTTAAHEDRQAAGSVIESAADDSVAADLCPLDVRREEAREEIGTEAAPPKPRWTSTHTFGLVRLF